MMKTALLFSAVLAMVCQAVSAQITDNAPQFDYNGRGLDYFLGKNLKFTSELRNCDKPRTLAAVKFKLDTNGKIFFLEVVGQIEDSTKNGLKALFIKTNGHWMPRRVNGKAMTSRLMIQPILYTLNDCSRSPQFSLYDRLDQSLLSIFSVPPAEADWTVLNLLVVTTNMGSSEDDIK